MASRARSHRSPARTTGKLAALTRTIVIEALTRLPHERVRAAVALARSERAARWLLAPLLWWLRRGPVQLSGGIAAGARLVRADLVACHMQAYGLVRGTLEQPVQEALRRTLTRGGTLYDVGANIGFFSLVGARLVGPDGCVYAFEPHPASAALIAANAAANGVETLTVLELAAGAASGREEFVDVREASWSRSASYGPHPDSRGAITVSVGAIDDLLEQRALRPPTVVKLDVEGAEIEVLEGMRRTIARHRPAIICELHATNGRFAELMRSVGYRLENLDGPEPVLDAGPAIHVLALPSAP